ncbi:MAG: hypothetical protein M1337_03660 [Actinobacteria bacterium]|nr:hypothetical protein [Actinomycetota bacterium]MCL5025729.1 hypothetical protein [Chloroflexota bacterium]
MHEDFVVSLAMTPDGKILATVVAGMVNQQFIGLIKLWDAASGSELGTLTQTDGTARSIVFSPDGRLLAAGSDNGIELWDTARRQRLLTLSGHTGSVGDLAFSPDGATLASGSGDGTVRLWRVTP